MATASMTSDPIETSPAQAHAPMPPARHLPPPAIVVDSESAPIYRISLELYNRMIELELLGPGDPIVLLDGLLVNKMPKGARHVTSTHRVFKTWFRRLPPGYHPRSESPVELAQGPDGDSAPEPDVVVVRGDDELYSRRHPGPRDVLLIVQVADSSVAADRRALRRFGWAGIPAVWIVNLRNRTVEVYTMPTGPVEDPGYAEKSTRGSDESLGLRLDEGTVIEVRVADFLA